MGAMGTTNYDQDDEQARLIRDGRFDQLDLEHIADEIADVGRSERRELESRMAVLLAHLLKWQFQAERRGTSWQRTIREQRLQLRDKIGDVPSLAPLLADPAWGRRVWRDAVVLAINETGLDVFPDECPWPLADVMTEDWLPSSV
jgi:hypothetical protein